MAKLSPSKVERFWTHVVKTKYCWVWEGAGDNRYGNFRFKNERVPAHRYAFWLAYGYWPECVCHKCDNPRCVRFDHLFAGSKAANRRDAAAKRRLPRGEGNPSSRLTTVQVLEMRNRHKKGEGYRRLSRAFGIARSGVQKIIRRELWAHV